MTHAMLVAVMCNVLAVRAHKCVLARNNEDTEYSVPLTVGSNGHTMHVAPDTGSFQLVIASKNCVGCEGHCMGCPEHELFDELASHSFVDEHEEVVTAYGQGQVSCKVGADFVQLAGVTTPAPQMMQLIKENEMQGFSQDASYDGIMGLGVTDMVPVTNATETPSLLSSLNVSTFGICFSLKTGEGGRLDLGSGVPGLPYHDVPGVGVGYWTIALGDLSVGNQSVACGHSPYCEAIIDSGTTLIGLPKSMLDSVVKLIGDIEPDCSTVDQLPSISIKVHGGYVLTLPPSAYIARMKDLTVTQPVKIGPFTANLPVGTQTACTHLFMESSMTSSRTNAPVLLIGMPIFRRYAIRFSRGKGSTSLSKAAGHSLGFAPLSFGSQVCTSCSDAPQLAAPDVALVGDISPRALQPDGAPSGDNADIGSESSQLRTFSASRLRMPSWAHTLRQDVSTGQYWI